MKTIRFYWHWFKLGRVYWDAVQQTQRLAALLEWLDVGIPEPNGSIADEMETWLAEQDEAA